MPGKMGDMHLDEPEHNFVNDRDCGLCKMTKEVVEIFSVTVCYFMKYVSKCTTKINLN